MTPFFFLQTEVFTKRLPSFYGPHQMTPYFSFAHTEKTPFFFSLSPKDPYFGGSCPHIPVTSIYEFPPPPGLQHEWTDG